MDNDNNKRKTYLDFGFNQSLSRELPGTPLKDLMQMRESQLRIKLLREQLKKGEVKNANETLSNKLSGLVLPRDKRLKSLKKMIELLKSGKRVSHFELSQCIKPSLTHNSYSHKQYQPLVQNRLRTARKYIKPFGVILKMVYKPERGYLLQAK